MALEKTIDVLGIGNAIIDVLADADDAFLLQHNLNKGSMTLVDEESSSNIYSSMKNKIGEDNLDGSHLSKAEAIIYSMTLSERQRPEQIGGSRRRRIAQGSGTSPQDVNQLLNQFKQIKKLMKDMSSPRGQKRLMSMMSQQKGGPFGF